VKQNDLRAETIRDFGEQWTAYRENDGYYGSTTLFQDIAGPFADRVPIAGGRVADIGSGTGRIVGMLLSLGAAQVTAVEPSAAMAVLQKNTEAQRERVVYVHGPGEDLPLEPPLDAVVSFGVLHHIPDPTPVVRRAFRALKPGGTLLVWLYGYEGNELYLKLTEPVRKVTTRLPHRALDLLSRALCVPLDAYVAASGVFPLPMASYMQNHIRKLSPEVRKLTIYDQLNPAYAKYYRREEARALLEESGFVDVELHHRHGYSWTVLGRRPSGIIAP
jgi:SAM-dependent methyltransferase